MNKQIEEMAQEMAGCERESCETCSVFLETLCVPLYIACRAYGAGYRKQSDVAKKIFGEIYEILNEIFASATSTCHNNLLYGNVDSPSGMRDMGIAQGVKRVGDAIQNLEAKMKGDKTDA